MTGGNARMRARAQAFLEGIEHLKLTRFGGHLNLAEE
jgi:hypothetical protein